MHRIMIVEDDEIISSEIKKNLKQWNYEVFIIKDFQKVMESFFDCSPHLVLLDVSLPFFDGYHWCQEIRKLSKVPIVFISSASENMNIVMAMNLGGDDYILKPFDLTVLEAKIKALIRRTYDFGKGTEILEKEGLILNLTEMTVTYEKKTVNLTKNEFKILETMLKQEGIIRREELMEKLWQSDYYIDDNTLTVNVGRLRKTLKELGASNVIHTKKGVGYYVGKE
ncbi:response regulator transcription factor [Gallicola sp. Sow4_E12]|uniref:response regulator transcription factor n=1 Tax=Gallicola sp. Sow4_E12 TaxID=3438785 RepID=UPI003F8F8E43